MTPTSFVKKDTYMLPTFELLEETNTNGFMFERGITRNNNFEMHDVNDGEELNYCISCIEIYKNENL